jgi:hypothetical protein
MHFVQIMSKLREFIYELCLLHKKQYFKRLFLTASLIFSFSRDTPLTIELEFLSGCTADGLPGSNHGSRVADRKTALLTRTLTNEAEHILYV